MKKATTGELQPWSVVFVWLKMARLVTLVLVLLVGEEGVWMSKESGWTNKELRWSSKTEEGRSSRRIRETKRLYDCR